MFPLSAVVQMCCPNIDISFASHRPTERLLMTFVGGNTAANRRTDYISGNNCNRDNGPEYDGKFESTSNRCCHLANDFTNITVHSGVLRPQGWRVHCTHAAAETSYDCARSLAVEFTKYTLVVVYLLLLMLILMYACNFASVEVLVKQCFKNLLTYLLT